MKKPVNGFLQPKFVFLLPEFVRLRFWRKGHDNFKANLSWLFLYPKRGDINMAIKTTQEQLEEVQAAIEQVLASQEMGWGPDRVKRPDLDTLYRQEARLQKRLAAEQGQGFAINTGLIRGYD